MTRKQASGWPSPRTPTNHLYAWVLRHYPEHGRSVVLYHDSDAASVHNDWFGDRPLLVRLGGYWWKRRHLVPAPPGPELDE